MRSPKKSESLELRISHEAKTAFMRRCHAEGRSASDVIRQLIAAHASEKSSKRDTSTREWRLYMSNLFKTPPVVVGLSLVGAVAALALMSGASASADPAQAFSAIDTDRDAFISLPEYLRAAEPVAALAISQDGDQATVLTPQRARQLLLMDYRAYDQDNDGRVSAHEFLPRFDITTRISFYAVDTNADGDLKLDELLQFAQDDEAGAQRLRSAFDVLDINADGRVTLQEYQTVKL